MTNLLEEAFAQLAQLPKAEQDSIARWSLEEMESDADSESMGNVVAAVGADVSRIFRSCPEYLVNVYFVRYVSLVSVNNEFSGVNALSMAKYFAPSLKVSMR